MVMSYNWLFGLGDLLNAIFVNIQGNLVINDRDISSEIGLRQLSLYFTNDRISNGSGNDLAAPDTGLYRHMASLGHNELKRQCSTFVIHVILLTYIIPYRCLYNTQCYTYKVPSEGEPYTFVTDNCFDPRDNSAFMCASVYIIVLLYPREAPCLQ